MQIACHVALTELVPSQTERGIVVADELFNLTLLLPSQINLLCSLGNCCRLGVSLRASLRWLSSRLGHRAGGLFGKRRSDGQHAAKRQ